MTRFKSNAEKKKEEEVSARESLEAKDALLARALDENKVFEKQLVLTFPCPPHPPPTQLICYSAFHLLEGVDEAFGGPPGGGGGGEGVLGWEETKKNVTVLFINRSKFYEEMKHMLIWNQVLNK